MPDCIAAELLENCKSEEEHTRIIDVAATSYVGKFFSYIASKLHLILVRWCRHSKLSPSSS